MDWIDKAYAEIEDEYGNGVITEDEYDTALYQLREDIRDYENHMTEQD
jgi:hypothetical protein